MKIEIKLETGRAVFIHCADSVDDWAFIKNVVDQLLKINPDEEAPVPGPKKKFTECLPSQKLPWPEVVGKPEKKLRGPYKKKPGPKPGKYVALKKFTKPVLEFLKQNCNTKNNDMLVKAIEDKFGFITTKHGVAWQMTYHSIKRKNPYHIKRYKSESVAGEKELPTLPPEDNY